MNDKQAVRRYPKMAIVGRKSSAMIEQGKSRRLRFVDLRRGMIYQLAATAALNLPVQFCSSNLFGILQTIADLGHDDL
jgi:hypothetical protein